MKKHIIVLLTPLISGIAFSQVGINTEEPKATLDIVGSPNDVTKIDGLIAPRLTGDELKSKDELYDVNQTGTILYVNEASSDAGAMGAKTINVDESGYYYFDGVVWQKLKGIHDGNNIYNVDGTLTSPRKLTLDGKNMEFLGRDQKTLFTSLGQIYQMGLPSSSTKTATISLIAADGDNNSESTRMDLQAFPEGVARISATGDTTGLTFSTNFTKNAAPIKFNTSPGANVGGQLRMTITGEGNIGIGTANPSQKFEVHTGGTSSAPITGFRLNDGTQDAGKVLTSNSTGMGDWQYPRLQRILGVLGSGINVALGNNSTGSYTGATLTLPPGKWQVQSTMLFNLGANACTLSVNDWIWVKTTFSNLSTSGATSPDIIGNSMVSGIFSGPKSASILYKYDILDGSFIINNTSGSNKTYYYWVHSTIADRPTTPTGSCTNLVGFAGSNLSENSIVAMPIL